MSKALLFPAFTTISSGREEAFISGISSVRDKMKSAGTENVTALFEKQYQPLAADEELTLQLYTYAFSCGLSDEFRETKTEISFVSGYSMGIYAALYHAGAFDFETGLDLITSAANFIRSNLSGRNFSNILVIGLKEGDIDHIIQRNACDACITNENNTTNFVLAAVRQCTEKLMEELKNEGAVHLRLLPYCLPYHSPEVADAAAFFRELIIKREIRGTRLPYLSSIDQRFITAKEDIIAELSSNLMQRMRWEATISKGITQADCLYECGPGDSLSRLSRFIPGNYIIFPFYRLEEFRNSP